jgi:hypothetical protein
VIVKFGSKWKLKFSDGREETFDSRAEAENRERQINYFKVLAKKGPPKKKGR